MNITTVTFFADMGIHGKVFRNRDFSFYIEKAKWLLSQSIPLIIFIDPCHVNLIIRMRKELIGNDYHKITMVVPFDISKDSEYMKKYTIEYLSSLNIEHDPLYVIITWIKFELMKIAMNLNPFLSTHFNWCDFGISHILPEYSNERNSYSLRCSSRKIKLLCLNHARDKVCHGPREFKFAAGFITGNIESWNKFIPLIENEMKKSTDAKWSNLEESLIEYVYIQNRNLFEFYYGYYVDVLRNYNGPYFSWDKLSAMPSDSNDQNYDFYRFITQSNEVSNQISEINNLCVFNSYSLGRFLEKSFLALWYSDSYAHHDELQLYCRKLLEISKRNENIYKYLIHSKDHWNTNFKFVKLYKRNITLSYPSSLKSEFKNEKIPITDSGEVIADLSFCSKFIPFKYDENGNVDESIQYILEIDSSSISQNRAIHISCNFCISNPMITFV